MAQGRFGKAPSYSELLDNLSTTPDERRSILHSYIEPTDDDIAEGRKVPTRAHHAIARLVQAGFIRVIITTNFDRLIENALREAGVEPTVIKSDDDLRGAVPLLHSRCYLVKVHGDYLDTRIRNTDRELSSYSKPMNALLDRIIDEHGLVVCGWSAEWDPALVAAVARAPNRRFSTFWAVRGQPTATAEDLVKQRDAKIAPIDGADTFFEKLERMVSAQNELQQPNPRSTALLVASAKKYLGRSEFRIQLGDLIGGEVQHITEATHGDEFGVSGAWSDEKFVARVARYEALVEPLGRIFGVLGRWGTGDEYAVASDIVGRFSRHEPGSGLTTLLGLRSYPGVLLAYAYGLGLLKAHRYGELYRIFVYPMPNDNGAQQTLVEQVPPGRWGNGMQIDAFKLLPDLSQRKTALSDHLADLFSNWAKDYAYTTDETTRLFEEFELLGSLAYLTVSTEKQTLDNALNGNASGRGFVYVPLGRAGWDGTNRRPILETWKQPGVSDALLGAGFAHKNPAYLTAAIENITRLSGRYEWT